MRGGVVSCGRVGVEVGHGRDHSGDGQGKPFIEVILGAFSLDRWSICIY